MLQFDVSGLIDTLGVGYYILVYGIGLLAMTLSVMAYQFPYRVTIILFNCFGQSSWVAHFLLQGDLTSAIACGLSAIMLAVFAQKQRWPWVTGPWLIALFIALISGFSLITFRTWMDIFPLMAGVFAVIANSRTTEKRLRQIAVLWCVSWLMNSILKMYPIALACDLLCTVSTIVALVRYGRKTRKPLNEADEKETNCC